MAVLQFFQSKLRKDAVHSQIGVLPAETVIQRRENHIFIDSGHEHLVIRILHHKTQSGPDLRQVFLYDRSPSDPNRSLSLKKSQQKFHDGRFSGAVGSDQSDRLPGRDGERDPVNHRIPFLIGKAYILKINHSVT